MVEKCEKKNESESVWMWVEDRGGDLENWRERKREREGV